MSLEKIKNASGLIKWAKPPFLRYRSHPPRYSRKRCYLIGVMYNADKGGSI